jgi:lambda repressor-like predicted transcriptional regulator
MTSPRTPTDGEEGKGRKRRMSHITFTPAIVRQEMHVRGLTIRQVALDASVSPQSVRRATEGLPMRSDTAIAIWNAIKKHPPAAEGFAEAVMQVEATG